jgi:two-component system, NtrC family, nitrogen regulation response regulator NtrX
MPPEVDNISQEDMDLKLHHTPYILVVDDEPDIRNLLQEILEDEGYEIAIAENGESARHLHRQRRPDLILLDIWMPDVDGITLLKEWSEDGVLPMPVIMMSGHGTVETAVEATRLGAYDFIEKPLSLAKLLLTVEHALEADKLNRENQGLRRHTHIAHEPIGKSAVMQRLREQIKRIAEHDSWILMQGEPGTGMRVLAHYLHSCSPHHDRPFIEINVAALDESTAAKELFGYEQNNKVHYGLLDQANGGTIYFQDIAEMDAATQAKLTSVLQAKSFTRPGGDTPVSLYVRIISATHQNLEQLVEEGQFRNDLYYLLNVVPLSVPSLREHREDVPELLNYYTNIFVDQEKLPYRKFSMAAQNRLRNYEWPGNIRELSNMVQRLLITSAGSEISQEEIEGTLGEHTMKPLTAAGIPASFNLPLREARDQFEKEYLEYQLEKNNGSVGKVAQIAGVERTHLYRKLKSLGIDPKNPRAK